MSRVHPWLTVVFAALLIPACLLTRLQLTLQPATALFLLGWALQSIIWATLLYQFGIPGSWDAFRNASWRLVPVALMTLVFVFIFGLKSGVMIAVAGIGILEFHYRKGDWKAGRSSLFTWAYLAAGIQIAIYYSAVIVSLRPCSKYDATFARFDTFMMFGGTVVGLSRLASALYVPAELVYYSIGGVMGATILFLCLSGDRRAAFQMCGAIVSAYYLSLVIFFALPAQGPFVSASLPAQLFTAGVQRASLANASSLYHHSRWMTPGLGYYVAFPSLHMAQPLIAAWFLRRWRRVSLIVLGYCILLVPAILILRWHYAIDVVGGIVVAAVAVLSVSSCNDLVDRRRCGAVSASEDYALRGCGA